eukprot:CAMPEP_0171335330 /NCGR_PEP_ID=MMETSP0878-20121228/5261_1 /TAXON_ID=67004 /ORGANISM="Thalassiosira weissflogii, Strain CCMP1336" /LENGTH=581 /DNA_ID=CAMNT_0011836579 /DNA_START=175 /DNA_END=1920 /DNA_ORIENTATION=+
MTSLYFPGGTPVYAKCISALSSPNLTTDERQDEILQCLGSTLDETMSGVNTFYLIYAASLVFYMQAGFAMLCAGSVRLKNVQNTMMKNLLDACGASLGYYSVGFAFAWGSSNLPGQQSTVDSSSTSFIGTTNFFLTETDEKAFFLFQYAFAATSATVVVGTLAERCQMVAYLCYSVFLTSFVYPVVVRSIWNTEGFLSSHNDDNSISDVGVGVIDFSGGLVVHVTGGLTALIAAYILGPRKGRFVEVDGKWKCRDFPGHSVALKVLGTLILWFGWYGFSTGSTYFITTTRKAFLAQNAAVNTTLAAAGGTMTSLLVNAWLVERHTGETEFNLSDALFGCLSGLVSITNGCAYVDSWAAFIIGMVSGIIYLGGTKLLVKARIDDAVDAIPTHMFCGLWGTVAVGLFAVPDYLRMTHEDIEYGGWFYNVDNGRLLGCQMIGILFVVGWVSAFMLPFFGLLHYLGWLRADRLEEIVGLDISYHGGISGRTQSDDNDDDASRQEHLDAYFERKRLRRESSRNNLRRRVIDRLTDSLHRQDVSMIPSESNENINNTPAASEEVGRDSVISSEDTWQSNADVGGNHP